MRNLKLQFCNKIKSNISNIKFLLTDPSGGKKYSDEKLFLVTEDKVYSTNEKFQNIKELAIIPNIVGAEFLSLTDEICIATSDGRVLSVAPDTGALNENSFCDLGLVSMAWSPEQEVVVFITKELNVVVMTCTYDPLCEHVLQSQCDQTDQFINVGWGRKETQFHGSEGKSAAKQKTIFEKPKDIESGSTDVAISWRYDGAYFAVSFVSSQYGRMFKVFDKEGTLQFNSEKMNGLKSPISWRPSGTWIAMPHELPNKSTVALFEKNGLRHREIVLPFNFSVERIVSLMWSTDSDILAIHTESTREDSSDLNSLQQRVYLYTIGNYHWYLKQTLSFGPGEQIASMQFGNGTALERTLHIMLSTGLYLKYSFIFGVDKFDNDGIVAVIDGRKLLLTNFSKAIVPPPMSESQIEIDSNINSCMLQEDRDNNALYMSLYDADGKISLYKTNFDTPESFTVVGIFKPDEGFEHKVFYYLANMTLCSHDQILATYCEDYTTNFLQFTLDRANRVYTMEATLEIDGIVNALHFNSVQKQVFVHTLNGSIRSLEILSPRIQLGREHVRLPHPAAQILSFLVNDEPSVIALCGNQSLYIDDQHIADYVTSVCLEGTYLAFTKHSELFLVRLTSRTIKDVRAIESGGRLITICTNTSRTILQMPRGNLEAFYPRLLLLDRVGKLLDNQKYDRVMDLLVKQRINLNIICDHDVNAFVNNIHLFAEEIHNVHWLNLFLSDLRNEDITKTMYASSYSNNPRAYPPDFQIEEKTKYICEKMLGYMENSENSSRFTLPIITANVKMGDMERALELIWQLKKQETSSNDKPQSEEALKYLLYLVDVNELYNVALGTYDFGLVLFVAQKSQRDPREFLPFLNELKKHDVDYRKFKIDEHLKRYEKALGHICKCSEEERFEEALEFIIRHQLYGEALKCYKHVPDYYKRVCLAYGDFLRAAGKLDNASLLYERGEDIKQALRCAKHMLDWKRVVYLAYKDNPQSVSEVALSIVPALQEKRMHSEAYLILKTYGKDYLEAVECLLKGNLHLKAIYETRLHLMENDRHVELLDSTILPNLCTYVELLQTNLSDSQQMFSDYKRRLLDVREQREKQRNDAATNGWMGEDVGFDESDLLSDTTSMRSSHYTGSSRGTGKTFRSSKNRRKHERKHFSLKPGNPFEDIALIDALYGHVIKVFEQQDHVRDTCKALLELEQDQMASKLQMQYKKFLTLIQHSLDAIWIPELATVSQSMPMDSNIDYKLYQNEQRYALLDPIKRFKPQIKLEDWEHAILT